VNRGERSWPRSWPINAAVCAGQRVEVRFYDYRLADDSLLTHLVDGRAERARLLVEPVLRELGAEDDDQGLTWRMKQEGSGTTIVAQ
jgi:hypothetical protein